MDYTKALCYYCIAVLVCTTITLGNVRFTDIIKSELPYISKLRKEQSIRYNTSYATESFSKITDHTLSNKEAFRHVQNIAFASHESIFVEDSVLTDIFIRAIECEDIQNEVTRFLFQKCRHDFLRKREQLIRQIIETPLFKTENRGLLNIYLLFPLNKKMRKRLLQFKNLNDFTKVKLGVHKEYYEKLCYEFATTTNGKFILHNAPFLGYIGDSLAIKSLLSQFDSNLIYQFSKSRIYSVRLPITKALAYIHPSEPLLTHIRVIEERTDNRYVSKQNITEEKMANSIINAISGVKEKQERVDYTILINRLKDITLWLNNKYKYDLPLTFIPPYFGGDYSGIPRFKMLKAGIQSQKYIDEVMFKKNRD